MGESKAWAGLENGKVFTQQVSIDARVVTDP